MHEKGSKKGSLIYRWVMVAFNPTLIPLMVIEVPIHSAQYFRFIAEIVLKVLRGETSQAELWGPPPYPRSKWRKNWTGNFNVS